MHKQASEVEEQNVEKLVYELKEKVIKDNGWVEGLTNLGMDTINVENSFQQSYEDANIPDTPRSVVFSKLDKIVKLETKKSYIDDGF